MSSSSAPVDIEEYRGEVKITVSDEHRNVGATSETQVSFVGLLAWALPPLALIVMLIVQGS